MPAQNLVADSNGLATGWTVVNTTVATDGTLGPDGTQATKVTASGAGAVRHYRNYIRSQTNVGRPLVFSAWLRAGTTSWVHVGSAQGTVFHRAWFNVTTGAVGTRVNVTYASIAAHPTLPGWWLCTVTWPAETGASRTDGMIGVATADNVDTFVQAGESVYAQMVALEESQARGDFVPTAAAAVDLGSPASKRLAQNLFTQSNDLTQAIWSKNAGVTATAATGDLLAPDGTSTANKIAYDGSGAAGAYRFFYNGADSYRVGGPYTFSFWARVAAGTKTLRISNYSALTTIVLDTTWRRFSVTFAGNGLAHQPVVQDAAAANAAFAAYFWHFQDEIGDAPGDYQPTTTVAIP